jgi:hypothetical protein
VEAKEPISAVMVRMPLVMRHQLEKIAKINRRSLSAQCQVLLEQFTSDPLAPPPTQENQ